MLHFDCDYTQGAHPRVLERLVGTNMEATAGYGFDEYCAAAREKIKAACGTPDAEVFFFVGGTQTNSTVISAVLKPWQGVISAVTGHINGHEGGAIEHSGHKVITLPCEAGKLSAAGIRSYLEGFYADEAWEHIAEPGMVYISFPTEYGTVYSQAELDAISAVCREYSLPLFIDGARLGYGLAAKGGDVTLGSLAAACDVFYIGGTKVGALFGEAVVFTNTSLCPHFFTVMKQHGAVLAKGRLLGLQFDALFTDDLYFSISRNAVDQAEKLKNVLKSKGYRLFIDSPTNQIFVVIEDAFLKKLAESVTFSVWERYDASRSVIRFATSWATTDGEVSQLIELL